MAEIELDVLCCLPILLILKLCLFIEHFLSLWHKGHPYGIKAISLELVLKSSPQERMKSNCFIGLHGAAQTMVSPYWPLYLVFEPFRILLLMSLGQWGNEEGSN